MNEFECCCDDGLLVKKGLSDFVKDVTDLLHGFLPWREVLY